MVITAIGYSPREKILASAVTGSLRHPLLDMEGNFPHRRIYSTSAEFVNTLNLPLEFPRIHNLTNAQRTGEKSGWVASIGWRQVLLLKVPLGADPLPRAF
jgi:hypothetical protein